MKEPGARRSEPNVKTAFCSVPLAGCTMSSLITSAPCCIVCCVGIFFSVGSFCHFLSVYFQMFAVPPTVLFVLPQEKARTVLRIIVTQTGRVACPTSVLLRRLSLLSEPADENDTRSPVGWAESRAKTSLERILEDCLKFCGGLEQNHSALKHIQTISRTISAALRLVFHHGNGTSVNQG